MKEIINKLEEKKMTLATMESCTGGGIVNAITNIEGASAVIKFSAVTYSNEFKIKMGVKQETIDKYRVYSEEVAREMSYNIAKYANSNYGIGITGKINDDDPVNKRGELNTCFISIYELETDKYNTYCLKVQGNNRIDSKKYIIDYIVARLKEIIN